MRLRDQVCVVTGGASGIGEAICRAYDREGAKVAVLDVDMMGAQRVAGELRNAVCVMCDVADPASVDRAFAEIQGVWGGVDVLVNNAGIVGEEEYSRVQETREVQLRQLRDGLPLTPLRATIQLTNEQWERMLAIHLNGTFYCSRAALTFMEKARRGVIINMSSINGIDGGMGNPHYAAAKAGVLGFTRAMAKEVILQGIRVNAIAPGFVETPIRESIHPVIQRAQIDATPIHRPCTADEVAATAVFLAGDESSYFVGQTLSPNGGYITH
ncbi:MAG: SDR family NAD(P)-dependent oxidoreductase [Rhodoferax sp.]